MVRFFTPTQEIDACGHVTIAIAQALHDLTVWSGEIPLAVVSHGGQFEVSTSAHGFSMAQEPRSTPGPVSTIDEVATVLAIPIVGLHTAATGLTHLFVEVENVSDLARIDANYERLASLGTVNNVDTIGVYSHLDAHRIRLRDFTAPIGVLEEPASGTTCGALATVTGKLELTIEQGIEMGRPSQIFVTVEGNHVVTSGRVRRVLTGQLDTSHDLEQEQS